jgi:hypothetical protein
MPPATEALESRPEDVVKPSSGPFVPSFSSLLEQGSKIGSSHLGAEGEGRGFDFIPDTCEPDEPRNAPFGLHNDREASELTPDYSSKLANSPRKPAAAVLAPPSDPFSEFLAIDPSEIVTGKQNAATTEPEESVTKIAVLEAAGAVKNSEFEAVEAAKSTNVEDVKANKSAGANAKAVEDVTSMGVEAVEADKNADVEAEAVEADKSTASKWHQEAPDDFEPITRASHPWKHSAPKDFEPVTRALHDFDTVETDVEAEADEADMSTASKWHQEAPDDFKPITRASHPWKHPAPTDFEPITHASHPWKHPAPTDFQPIPRSTHDMVVETGDKNMDVEAVAGVKIIDSKTDRAAMAVMAIDNTGVEVDKSMGTASKWHQEAPDDFHPITRASHPWKHPAPIDFEPITRALHGGDTAEAVKSTDIDNMDTCSSVQATAPTPRKIRPVEPVKNTSLEAVKKVSYPFDPRHHLECQVSGRDEQDQNEFACDCCEEEITTVRFKCISGCTDFDMCSSCHDTHQVKDGHDASHECIKLPIGIPNESLVFKTDWQPEDELKILECVGLYGLDWVQVCNAMGFSNTKAHYEEEILTGARIFEEEQRRELGEEERDVSLISNDWSTTIENVDDEGFGENREGEYLHQYRHFTQFPIQRWQVDQMDLLANVDPKNAAVGTVSGFGFRGEKASSASIEGGCGRVEKQLQVRLRRTLKP